MAIEQDSHPVVQSKRRRLTRQAQKQDSTKCSIHIRKTKNDRKNKEEASEWLCLSRSLLRARAARWKNFVFLSPSLNHVILYFCRQLIFSNLASLLHYSLAETLRADDRGLDSSVRSRYAISSIFFKSTLPNCSLFHFLFQGKNLPPGLLSLETKRKKLVFLENLHPPATSFQIGKGMAFSLYLPPHPLG